MGISSSSLKDIGLLPSINSYNDRSGVFSRYKRNLMRVVDLVPVYFTIETSDLFKAGSISKPISLKYEDAVAEFRSKLTSVGLPTFSGIRAWVTNESSSQDEIQNSFKENKISETLNTQLDTLHKIDMFELLKSAGGLRTSAIRSTLTNPLAAALIDGRHLSLPRIWEKSDYNPSLSLSVKLNSPYGNKDSFRANIAEPLLTLMALVSPSSYDGITYGLPSYVTIRAYGVSYMSIATPDSISIIRGGSDVRVNGLKQPLEINVSMSFKPALPGFAAMIGGTGDIASISDVESAVSGVTPGSFPGITTLGSIIESLRPVPESIRAIPPTLGGGIISSTPGSSGVTTSSTSSLASGLLDTTSRILVSSGVASSMSEAGDLLSTV